MPTIVVQPVPAPTIVQMSLPPCGIPTTTTTTSTTTTSTATGPTSTTTTQLGTSSTTSTLAPTTTTSQVTTSSTTTSASTSSTTTAGPTTTTTTTLQRTSTTTTTLPGGCEATPTFTSLGCRLDSLVAAVGGAGEPSAEQALAIPLEKARARVERATTVCGTGDARDARRDLRYAIRRMTSFERRLHSRIARGVVPSGPGADLLGTADGITGDLRTLEDGLVCPPPASAG